MIAERIAGNTTEANPELGREMHELIERLWPFPRSITGQGVRDTLAVIREHIPALEICKVPTGAKCFDWEVPKEWNIRDAYILDPDGRKIVDFKQNNLHVVGYSVPVDGEFELEELEEHLHSLPEQPDAIPYITSYYQERWGFCLSHSQRQQLKPGRYRAVIDSTLQDGTLAYGELLLPGSSEKEIFLSTYICHPSLANNELSGPVVTTYLAKWLAGLADREFSYRIIFIPETIGSITYLSRNLEKMRERIVAGFNVTCMGDERTYSYVPSRDGETLADRVIRHVLKHVYPDYASYTYLDRGSDERQYCSPGVDLPVASLMRTRYGSFPEYHTSLDDLQLVTPSGLFGGYAALRKCIECLENNGRYRVSVFCEPQLGKRGLYPTLSVKGRNALVRRMMDLIAYSDGTKSLLEIAETIDAPMWELVPIVEKLAEEKLLIPASLESV